MLLHLQILCSTSEHDCFSLCRVTGNARKQGCKAGCIPDRSSNIEVFSHLGEEGLPSPLLLEIAVTIIVAFTVRQLLTSLAEHAAKQASHSSQSLTQHFVIWQPERRP